MLVDTQHRLIARPEGISGISPKKWCSVCGKVGKNPNFIPCDSVNCPNVCHAACSLDGNNFICSNVATLRNSAGISDPIEFVSTKTLPLPSNLDLPDDSTGINLEKEDLLSTSKEELIDEIQLMRKDYQSTIALGRNLKRFSESLAGTRDSIVQALEFIDSLTATVNNIQEPARRSIACSAIPERIDAECEQTPQTVSGGNPLLYSNKDKTLKSINAKRASAVKITHNPQATKQSSGLEEIQKVPPTKQNPAKSKSSFCSSCRRRGHTSDNCRSKLNCDFCHKTGHTRADCRTRIAEEKQRSFFSTLLSEQANQTASLLQSFHSKLVQSVVPPTQIPHYGAGYYRGVQGPFIPAHSYQYSQYAGLPTNLNPSLG